MQRLLARLRKNMQLDSTIARPLWHHSRHSSVSASAAVTRQDSTVPDCDQEHIHGGSKLPCRSGICDAVLI